MKTHITLSKDYTSLITELTAYIKEAGKDQDNWFWAGPNTVPAITWETCCSQLPSLATTFADLGLTVYGFGHRFIHKDQQSHPNVFGKSTLTIPLTTNSFTVTIYQPHSDAKIFDNWYYLRNQCDKIESISSTEPMLVNRDVSYIMEPTEDIGLIPFLVIMFSDTDSLFAE
jgi:hypothetical protein